MPKISTLFSLAISALMLAHPSSMSAEIVSNFDDLEYPGSAGGGWVGPWEHASTNVIEILTSNPLDGESPYLQLGTAVGGTRNVMRQYESSGVVDIARPHYIRWKFRLSEEDFDNNFLVFNDRVHFFARHARRLTGSTDGNVSWSIMATGNEQSEGSGISAGKTFWIFDNVDGTGSLSLTNYVDSQIVLLPNQVYSFEVLVDVGNQSYSVSIANETSSTSFTSSAPHRFRSSTVTAESHTMLHFGIQASPVSELRPFDLDSISIVPALLISAPNHTGSAFTFSFTSSAGRNYIVEFKDALDAETWTPIDTIAGDGLVKNITDANPSSTTRYYRVRSE